MKTETKVIELQDPWIGTSAVILESSEFQKRIPVWIGSEEADSIRTVLNKTAKNSQNDISMSKDEIEKIVITKKEDVYQALIYLKKSAGDAIALALKHGCPIYADSELFNS